MTAPANPGRNGPVHKNLNRIRRAPRRIAPWILGAAPPKLPVDTGVPPPTPAEADAIEPGRGRAALNPRHIPAKGWRDIALRTWRSFNADRLPAVSAGVAFYGLLSLFPTMAAFVSLYGLFFDVATAQQQLSLLTGVVPADILTMIGEEMTRIAGTRTGDLSLTFGLSLLLALWGANAASKALFGGLNVAYHEREKRNILKLNAVTLAFTLATIVFLMLAVGAVVVVPILFNLLPLGIGATLIALVRWPLLMVIMAVGLSALYRFGPSRRPARWRWLSWGAAIAALLWLGASLAFSWYVGNIANYARTYGSLGAVIGLMMWLWVSALVVLLGAELNSEIEHQTAQDTTTGGRRPMGERGAIVADSLGEASGKDVVKAETPIPAAG
jgi:membrane protein